MESTLQLSVSTGAKASLNAGRRGQIRVWEDMRPSSSVEDAVERKMPYFPQQGSRPIKGGGDLQVASLVDEFYTKHICGFGGRRVCSSLSSTLSWRAKLEYSGGRGGTYSISTSPTLARASDGARTMACTLDPYRHHGPISVTLRGLHLCSCHV